MNLDGKNKSKNNQSMIITIVLLIIAIVAVIFTAIYLKNNNKDQSNDKTPSSTNSPSPSIEPTPSQIPTELSSEELSNYLANVPMLLEYDLEKTYYDYNLDAYTGQSVTISDISPKLLLATAYYKTEKSFIKDPACTDKMCSGKEAMLVDSIKNTIKKLYNIDVNSEDSFPIIGGTVTKNGEEYNANPTRGSVNYTKVLSKVKDYKIEGNTLTITEEASFTATSINMPGYLSLFKYTNTSEELGNFKTTDEVLTYLNENPSNVATFKHTFKYENANGFYYYSTEELK